MKKWIRAWAYRRCVKMLAKAEAKQADEAWQVNVMLGNGATFGIVAPLEDRIMRRRQRIAKLRSSIAVYEARQRREEGRA